MERLTSRFLCCCDPIILKIWIILTFFVNGIILLGLSLAVFHFPSILISCLFILSNILVYLIWFRKHGRIILLGVDIGDADIESNTQDSFAVSSRSSALQNGTCVKFFRVFSSLFHLVLFVMSFMLLFVRVPSLQDPLYTPAQGFPHTCMDSRPDCCRILSLPDPVLSDMKDDGNVCSDIVTQGIHFVDPEFGFYGVLNEASSLLREYWNMNVVEEYGDGVSVNRDKGILSVPDSIQLHHGDSSLGSITAKGEYNIHARILTALVGFPDDFCIRVVKQAANAQNPNQINIAVSVHSKSRLGSEDNGVNRKRAIEYLSLLRERVRQVAT